MNPRTQRSQPAHGTGFVVGLTGGIASGKSTVAKIFARRGAVILDADAIGHEVIAPRRAAWREIRRAFGTGVLRANGAVDRPRLGAMVFAAPRLRRRLNRIVHPRILAELTRRVRRHRRAGDLVVVDAALLLEFRWPEPLDLVVVVDAPRRAQLERLREAGFSAREAANRVRSQMPRARRNAAADRVLPNEGGRRELARRAAALWREIATMREGMSRAERSRATAHRRRRARRIPLPRRKRPLSMKPAGRRTAVRPSGAAEPRRKGANRS